MSIAVSALIRPSRLLRLLEAALAVLVLFVAAFLWAGPLAYLSPFVRCSLAFPLVTAGLGLLISAFRTRKSFQLDISGLGEIRLREHYTGAEARAGESSPDSATAATVGMLDCTLWSWLLALHLVDAGGRRRALLILPDMIEPGAFRALSVALVWIRSQPRNATRVIATGKEF